MKALEILRNQENIFPENAQSKRIKPIAKAFTNYLSEMDTEIRNFSEFIQDETNGELANRIIIAKSLAEFFTNNKILRVDLVAENYKNQEKSKLNQFYSAKTKLLDALKSLLRESQKEAVISNFDLFEGDFIRCEAGHEIIILNGRNSGVIEQLIKEFDQYIVMNGAYDNLGAQEADYNSEVLDRNIELCNRKNQEVNGSKSSKQVKLESIIQKLHEIGKQVVAFYTYKDTLIEIGCNSKNVKVYENELSKAYIPLKKLVQKELGVELEDICEIVVNEEEYSDEVEVSAPNTWENESPALTEEIIYTEHKVQDLLAETEEMDKNVIDVMSEEEVNNTDVTARDIFESPVPTEQFSQPETQPQTNPFEYTTQQSSMVESNPFEMKTDSIKETTSNPFEVPQTNLFEAPVNPFANSNPFEQSTNPANTNYFEQSAPTQPTNNNPFEIPTPAASTNPFEQTTYSNPFENTTSTINQPTYPNPFEQTASMNNFNEEVPNKNPFSTNIFED